MKCKRKIIEINQNEYVALLNALEKWKKPIPSSNPYKITNKYEDSEGNQITFHFNNMSIRKANLFSYSLNIENNTSSLFKTFFLIIKLINKKYILGSDEVGKSDYFGPLIVCSLYYKNIKDDDVYNFSDSKKTSFNRANTLFKEYKEKVFYSTCIAKPVDMWNFLTSKKWNLNHILLFYHCKSLLSTLNYLQKTKVQQFSIVIDDFTNNNTNLQTIYFQKILPSFDKKNLTMIQNNSFFLKKADIIFKENKLASIFAKYFFILEIQKIQSILEKQWELKINFQSFLGNSTKTKQLIFNLKDRVNPNQLKQWIKPIYWQLFKLI